MDIHGLSMDVHWLSKNDPDDVTIDFINSRVCDHSALKAIDDVAARYLRHNKKLHLIHLRAECKLLLDKGSKLVENNDNEDPYYHIATDN